MELPTLFKLNNKRGRENLMVLIIKSDSLVAILFNHLVSITFDKKNETEYIFYLFNDLYRNNELKILSINNVCPINCKYWYQLNWQPFEYYEVDFMGIINYNQVVINIYNYESYQLKIKLKEKKYYKY